MSVTRVILSSRDEWLKAREGHLGGSDASACLGLNPYKSNVALWEEKTGRRQMVDISDRPYVQYGIQAEQHLRELFRLDYPQYSLSYYDNNMYLNTDFPWMHASLDGELQDEVGRRGIFEVKTTNILQSGQWEQWRDRIPDNYYIQLLHYLAVTGWEFAVLKAQIKSERDGEITLTTKHYFIEKQEIEEDIMLLIEAERNFWNNVSTNKKPDLILPAI